jgi:hypothetical protein
MSNGDHFCAKGDYIPKNLRPERFWEDTKEVEDLKKQIRNLKTKLKHAQDMYRRDCGGEI